VILSPVTVPTGDKITHTTTYNGDMNISRRELMLAAVATASAQAPPKPQPEAGLDAARQQQRAGAEAIARIPLPMTTEPAFQFKA
jgi:hypothetical protein